MLIYAIMLTIFSILLWVIILKQDEETQILIMLGSLFGPYIIPIITILTWIEYFREI